MKWQYGKVVGLIGMGFCSIGLSIAIYAMQANTNSPLWSSLNKEAVRGGVVCYYDRSIDCPRYGILRCSNKECNAQHVCKTIETKYQNQYSYPILTTPETGTRSHDYQIISCSWIQICNYNSLCELSAGVYSCAGLPPTPQDNRTSEWNTGDSCP
jgi:hypothetical protein